MLILTNWEPNQNNWCKSPEIFHLFHFFKLSFFLFIPFWFSFDSKNHFYNFLIFLFCSVESWVCSFWIVFVCFLFNFTISTLMMMMMMSAVVMKPRVSVRYTGRASGRSFPPNEIWTPLVVTRLSARPTGRSC